jgi:acylphosphatase
LVFESLEGAVIGFGVSLSKARIVVDGVVQGVGYRALVKQIARQFGLKGLVRNFEGTRAEIFCEGPRDKIREFLKKIDRKAEAEDFLSINVSSIKCFFEGEENYQPAWKEYKDFEIDYGVEELSSFDEATLEDHEFSKLYFIGFRDELKDFRQDTNKNFKEMAEKYGDISVELKEFRKTVKGFLDAFLSEYQKRTTNP